MKKILSLLVLALFFTSCGIMNKYKDLEPGIYANIVTDKGNIMLKLEYKKAPMTVANFVGLAEGNFTAYDTIKFTKPYFNGLKFHRVVNDFMIQGGDPTGTGSGGPGYSFPDEFEPSLTHDSTGTLSMANSGIATNGSQFFITHKPTPFLDKRHSVFGYVISGQNVVDSIAQNDVMKEVNIIRVGKEAKKWNATETFKTVMEAELEKQKKMEEELKAEAAAALAYAEKVKGMTPEAYSAFMFEEVKVKYPNAKLSPTGLVYMIEEPGVGELAHAGDKLFVHYRGTFRLNGRQFDSSYDRKTTMDFIFMEQRMIPGFEEALAMLAAGGKAKIFIPYYQAYGANGRPGQIPPYSDLVFDLELVNTEKGTGHEGHGH